MGGAPVDTPLTISFNVPMSEVKTGVFTNFTGANEPAFPASVGKVIKGKITIVIDIVTIPSVNKHPKFVLSVCLLANTGTWDSQVVVPDQHVQKHHEGAPCDSNRRGSGESSREPSDPLHDSGLTTHLVRLLRTMFLCSTTKCSCGTCRLTTCSWLTWFGCRGRVTRPPSRSVSELGIQKRFGFAGIWKFYI